MTRNVVKDKAGAVLLLTKEAAVEELYRRIREVLMVQVGSGSAPPLFTQWRAVERGGEGR